jgi:hypothetical protein
MPSPHRSLRSGAIWIERFENRKALGPRTGLGTDAASREVHQLLTNCRRVVGASR